MEVLEEEEIKMQGQLIQLELLELLDKEVQVEMVTVLQHIH